MGKTGPTKITCPKGFEARCVKIRKKRPKTKSESASTLRQDIKLLIASLPKGEKATLRKLNLKLEDDKNKLRKQRDELLEVAAKNPKITPGIKSDMEEKDVSFLTAIAKSLDNYNKAFRKAPPGKPPLRNKINLPPPQSKKHERVIKDLRLQLNKARGTIKRAKIVKALEKEMIPDLANIVDKFKGQPDPDPESEEEQKEESVGKGKKGKGKCGSKPCKVSPEPPRSPRTSRHNVSKESKDARVIKKLKVRQKKINKFKDKMAERKIMTIPIPEEEEQKGEGGGMYDSQIDDVMKNSKNYIGTIAVDQIPTLNPKPKMSWIQNTDPAGAPGKHWCAVYVDAGFENEVDYYDPFGHPPPKIFLRDIKKISDKVSPDKMLKLKINTVKNQDVSSDNCGWMCINFLKKRESGMSFKRATGFKEIENQDNSKGKEIEAENLKNKFGYT